MNKQLEEGHKLQLDFAKLKKIGLEGQEVVPVAVQDVVNNEVILIAYVNDQALKVSLERKKAVFWSTSRNELWEKGKSSGNTFSLLEVLVNCEQNSLVFKVQAEHGEICHTKNSHGKNRNCFYRRVINTDGELENLDP